jgi:flotillin
MPAIIAGVVLVLIIVILTTGYVKAAPDVALIISGLNKQPRVLIGQAGIKIPFFERVDYLHLGQISVDIKTDQYIPTNDFINVKVDAVAKVRVDSSPEGMLKAERNFLNKNPQDIASELEDSLQGNMREIIGTLDLKTINTDRDSFSDQVMEKASRDMEKLGIEILSCNIQNVTDENGLITDLGMDNTAKIKKDAAIAKAEADKEVAIAQAKADREANAERVSAETEIAEKNNELEIKRASLKSEADAAKAKADAAYKIQEQEQEKTIQTATVNAQIARAEREAHLKAQEVSVKEQELAATVKKQAEADKYAAEQAAEADLVRKKKEAEAARYAAEQQAEAIKAQATAEADAFRIKGEAEAKAIKAKGEAEAAAIKAKGEAEAAALEKRAEALKGMPQIGALEMMLGVAPEMVESIAKPLSSIGSVSIYDSGSGEGGIASMTGMMPIAVKQAFDTMSEATGVDMRELLRAETYDGKVNRNIRLEGPAVDKLIGETDPETEE